MKLLLDTHVFLWYIAADARLPAAFSAAIQDSTNEVFLSVASIWEAVVKHGLGKLSLPDSPAIYLPRQREGHRIVSLPIDEGSLAFLADLPPLHRDPFDRILVAQAMQHGLIVLTVDDAVLAYGVKSIPS